MILFWFRGQGISPKYKPQKNPQNVRCLLSESWSFWPFFQHQPLQNNSQGKRRPGGSEWIPEFLRVEAHLLPKPSMWSAAWFFNEERLPRREDDAICYAMLMCFTLEVVWLVGWSALVWCYLDHWWGFLFWRWLIKRNAMLAQKYFIKIDYAKIGSSSNITQLFKYVNLLKQGGVNSGYLHEFCWNQGSLENLGTLREFCKKKSVQFVILEYELKSFTCDVSPTSSILRPFELWTSYIVFC